jgi:hypothetical protein
VRGDQADGIYADLAGPGTVVVQKAGAAVEVASGDRAGTSVNWPSSMARYAQRPSSVPRTASCSSDQQSSATFLGPARSRDPADAYHAIGTSARCRIQGGRATALTAEME